MFNFSPLQQQHITQSSDRKLPGHPGFAGLLGSDHTVPHPPLSPLPSLSQTALRPQAGWTQTHNPLLSSILTMHHPSQSKILLSQQAAPGKWTPQTPVYTHPTATARVIVPSNQWVEIVMCGTARVRQTGRPTIPWRILHRARYWAQWMMNRNRAQMTTSTRAVADNIPSVTLLTLSLLISHYNTKRHCHLSQRMKMRCLPEGLWRQQPPGCRRRATSMAGRRLAWKSQCMGLKVHVLLTYLDNLHGTLSVWLSTRTSWHKVSFMHHTMPYRLHMCACKNKGITPW